MPLDTPPEESRNRGDRAGGGVRLGPLREFLATETSAAAILLVATLVALAWSNSPWSDCYERLWHTTIALGVVGKAITLDLRHWLNDGLMSVFFFVVGVEIKRELVGGELATPRRALLPVVAAAGGMALPALIYLAVTAGSGAARGWGIPMATDIAFALGALALLAPRAPGSLRVFLLSLAIVDDIGAILVIAVFYADGISWIPLVAGAALLAAIAALIRARVAWLPLYVVLAVCVWLAVFESGVHATIAGVALGLLVPARTVGGEERSPAERVEHALHPWSSYVVVPLFALANAGVALTASALASAVASRITIGIALGLVIGKPVGIAVGTAVARRLGLPPISGARPRETTGIAALAGIGFTVSLFVASLAFSSAELVAEAKVGILVGSVVAAGIGALLLRPGVPTGPATLPRDRARGE